MEYLATKKCSKVDKFTQLSLAEIKNMKLDIDKIIRVSLSRYHCVPQNSLGELCSESIISEIKKNIL